MNRYVLYIGKSNNQFTYDRLYAIYYDPNNWSSTNEKIFIITLYNNKENLVTFRIEHLKYFNKNFKVIKDENELIKLQRKLKLKKISKIKKL
jgi:hypothetical protein